MTLYLLTLIACLSTLRAPRSSLLRPAPSEVLTLAEVHTRQQAARGALLEQVPGVLSVGTSPQTPCTVDVVLSEGALPGTLDVVADRYALEVDPPCPVRARAIGCRSKKPVVEKYGGPTGQTVCTDYGVISMSTGAY